MRWSESGCLAIRSNLFAAEPNEKVTAPIRWRDTGRQYGPERSRADSMACSGDGCRGLAFRSAKFISARSRMFCGQLPIVKPRTRLTTPMCKTFQGIFPKSPDWIICKAWEFAPPCLLLLLLLLCSVQVRAAGATDDDTTTDPIDKFYNECIDRNGSTAGMSDCTRQAARMWDAEMNKAYNKLLNLLGPTKSQALRESQRAWIMFRDQEFRAIDDIYSLLQGTMYVPAQEYSRLRLVKERTLLLRHYVSLIAESRDENN